MDGTPVPSTEASRQPHGLASTTMPPPPVPAPRNLVEDSYFVQHGDGPAPHGVGQKAPAKRPARSGARKAGPSTLPGSAAVAVRHSARIPVRSAKAAANMASSARIKLKFSQKGEQQKLAPGHFMSPFGEYTRELDEDPEEPLAFEEQFILRVPKEVAMGDSKRGIKGLNQLLDERKEVDGVWFKFKDARRAVFHHADQNYAAKLVDLPCIIESQKTLDKKRLFKVADISQMLIVEYPVPSEDSVIAGIHDPEAFVWQHGLTPPLHYVRQRRWRKRKIGDKEGARIEAEVERLLKLDNEARNSSLSFVDIEPAATPNPDDEEGYDEEGDFEGSQWDGSELQTGTPRSVNDGESAFGDDQAERDVGMELSAALNDEQEELDEHTEDEEDEEDDDVEDEEEDEDEEMAELRQQQKLFDQEVRDLQQIVDRKQAEIQSISSVILKVRAQNGLARPMQELRAKTQARDENQARIDSKIQAKEAAKLVEAERRAAENAEKEKAAAAADAAKEAGGEDEDEDEDDLFGENEDDENEDTRENAQPPQEASQTVEQPEVDVWADESDDDEEEEEEEDGDAEVQQDNDTDMRAGQEEASQAPANEEATNADSGADAGQTIPAQPAAVQWGFDVDDDDEEED